MSAENASERITQAGLARLLGVSRAAVHKAVKTGRIVAGEDGHFDRDRAVADWKANTRPAAPKKPREQSKYAEARARREDALADMAEMRRLEMRGELISSASVEQGASDALGVFRAKLDSLSDRLAGGMVGLGSIEEAAEIINSEVDTFFDELHADLQSLVRVAARSPDGG